MTDISLSINESQLNQQIKQTLQAAIIAMFSDKHESIFGQMIESMINMKVDQNGHASTSSYGTCNYLEWVARQTVQKALKEGVEEYMNDHKEELKKAIKEKINKNKSAFFKGMAEKIIHSIPDKIYASVQVSYNDRD